MAVCHLPEEILVMICGELGRKGDFPSLFACALTNVAFSHPALRTMYGFSELSSLISETDDVERLERYQSGSVADKVAQQNAQLRRWALLWRSIIRSSLDKTYAPYCLYIRTLNLDNLLDLFAERKFAHQIERGFFADDLQGFHHQKKLVSPPHELKPTQGALDVTSILHAVCDVISIKSTLLEELQVDVHADALARWIRRLPRLQGLRLQDGQSLGSEARAAIKDNCPYFKSLIIYAWRSKNADHDLESFLDMTSGLKNFELYSSQSIGSLSLLAMNHHSSTLTSLKLLGLHVNTFRSLYCLNECAALQRLELGTAATTYYPLILPNEVTSPGGLSWLKNCHDLKELAFENVEAISEELTEVLTSRNFALTSLSMKNYAAHGAKSAAFHAAMAEQPSLTMVILNSEGDFMSTDDLEIMVDALDRLPKLKTLKLNGVSDEFTSLHIEKLAASLPFLETFHSSGMAISDSVLEPLAKLKKLRDMQFLGGTQFSATALATFISSLDPYGNKGLTLHMWAVDPPSELSDHEQDSLRELISRKLDGKLGMMMGKGYISNDDSESDFSD